MNSDQNEQQQPQKTAEPFSLEYALEHGISRIRCQEWIIPEDHYTIAIKAPSDGLKVYCYSPCNFHSATLQGQTLERYGMHNKIWHKYKGPLPDSKKWKKKREYYESFLNSTAKEYQDLQKLLGKRIKAVRTNDDANLLIFDTDCGSVLIHGSIHMDFKHTHLIETWFPGISNLKALIGGTVTDVKAGLDRPAHDLELFARLKVTCETYIYTICTNKGDALLHVDGDISGDVLYIEKDYLVPNWSSKESSSTGRSAWENFGRNQAETTCSSE